MARKVIMAIPDLQIPFEHKDALKFLKAVYKKYRPQYVVNMGDELDMHALGNWDKDPDGYSAGHELILSIERLKEHYKAFPEVLVCTSNHTARPFRRAFKYGIPKAFIKDYKEFLNAPRGWDWAESWEIDNIIFEHGEGFSGKDGAMKAAMQNMQSTVIGHIHSFAGINFYANEKELIFGFNVGALIDRYSYAFAYSKKFKAKPILGCGIIIDRTPQFIPMILNKRGRWIGRL